MEPVETLKKPANDHENHDFSAIERARRLMGVIGYFMLATTCVVVVAMIYRGLVGDHKAPTPPNDEGVFVWFMQYYSWETFSVIGAAVLATVGLRLLGAAGKTTPRVIPLEDRELLQPLVQTANKEAIEQYVILSSLSGFTGTFQKIGFSGLPLATVTLTLIFCALSFVKLDFIEFAKLTLGAFIGSFVQRGSDAPKLPSIKWEK